MARGFFVRNIQSFVGVGIGCMFGATMIPQTFGLGRYRRLVAQYKDGEEQPLDEATAALAEQVTIACKLTPEEEAGLDFFTTYSQDPCQKGSVKLRTGAVIGLPASFVYASPEQVQTDQIQLGGRFIDWESDEGRSLRQSLVLSRPAKEFVVAREVMYANTHHIWVVGGLRAGTIFAAFATSFALGRILQLRRIFKPWARGAFYSTIAAGYLVVYLIASDTYFCRRDLKADARAAKLDARLAAGGVEVYSKQMARNVALRQLLGPDGANLYTAYGNQKETWRRSHATLSERRDRLVNYLQGLQEHPPEGSSNQEAEHLG